MSVNNNMDCKRVKQSINDFHYKDAPNNSHKPWYTGPLISRFVTSLWGIFSDPMVKPLLQDLINVRSTVVIVPTSSFFTRCLHWYNTIPRIVWNWKNDQLLLGK